MLQQTRGNLTNRVVSGLLLVVAATAAGVLVWLGQAGGLELAVFVTVTIVATIAALHSNRFGLMAIIFIAAVDGFVKGLSPGWHTQLLKDYLIAICLLRWAWLSVMGHRRESVRLPVAVPILIFAGWVGVQFFNTRSHSVLVNLAGLRMWTIWLPTFFLAYDAFDTRRSIERLVIFLVILMIPLSVYGIVQFQIGLDHLFKLGPGFDVYTYEYYPGAEGQRWRPPSTMVQPHNFAGALTMVILLAFGAAGYFNRRRLLQILIVAAVPLMGVAMLLTAVRNAAVSAVIGIAALVVIRRRVDLAVLMVLVGSLAIYQVDAMTAGDPLVRIRSVIDNPQYTVGRIVGPWRMAARRVVQRPLGSGIAVDTALGRMGRPDSGRTFDPEREIPHIENEYGRALLELGLPGFLIFLWMLFAVMRTTYHAYRRVSQARDKWLLAGIFAACVTVLSRLLVGPALYTWPEAPIFWYLIAVAARMPAIEHEELVHKQAPDPETRATVLGEKTLPWAREKSRR